MSSKPFKSSQQRKYDEYFKTSGIRVTDEPIGKETDKVSKLLDKYYPAHSLSNKVRVRELPKIVEQYPDVISFKNYLYASYQMAGMHDKAEQLLDEIIEEHPTYIFGFTNRMLNAKKEELLDMGHFLGADRDIRNLITDREIFHYTEFVNYQHAAALYELAIDEEDAALERLDSLIAIGAHEEITDKIARVIAIHRIEKMSDNFNKRSGDRISIEGIAKISYPQTKIPPEFNHPEIEWFYENPHSDLPEKQRNIIINLPRQTLIADLQKVLEDGIRRYEFFQDQNYDEDRDSFYFHALHFIGALKAEDCLEKVLDLLRMGRGFMEFWFSDWADSLFFPTLFYIGKEQLTELSQFLKEESIDGYNRTYVTHAIAQVALHEPIRRTEILDWFKDILEFHLTNPNNEKIIDSDFFSLTVSYLIDIRANELWSVIQRLYQQGWVDEFVAGDLKDIKKEIFAPAHPYHLKPFPLNIHEYYTQVYEQRRADPPAIDENDLKVVEKIRNPSRAEAMVLKVHMEMLLGNPSEDDGDYYEEYDDFEYVQPTKPIVRTSPKVGRNAPCPCGSGKKYKKCCLNK